MIVQKTATWSAENRAQGQSAGETTDFNKTRYFLEI